MTTTAATEQRPPLEELHQRLREAVEQLETGEQWQAWLQFARGFHRYSFNNLILIWAQRPDATAVASYRTWQAGPAGPPRRDRHPGPRPHPAPHPDPRRPRPTGPRRRRQAAAAAAVPGTGRCRCSTSPRPTDRPSPNRPAGAAGRDAPAGLWDALVREVTERGYRVRRGSHDDLRGANGVTNPPREVWVRDDVDDAQAVKTLAHELAHVILHTHPDPAGHDRRTQRRH